MLSAFAIYELGLSTFICSLPAAKLMSKGGKKHNELDQKQMTKMLRTTGLCLARLGGDPQLLFEKINDHKLN